jgi:hypothetical protein
MLQHLAVIRQNNSNQPQQQQQKQQMNVHITYNSTSQSHVVNTFVRPCCALCYNLGINAKLLSEITPYLIFFGELNQTD